MLKRAVAVGYIAFFAYTLLPGLLYQIGGGQPSMTTVTLFATIGSALGAIAYLLVRKNERVVFERRAALGAAFGMVLVAVADNGVPDLIQRVIGAVLAASLLYLLVFSVAVTIHVLAYGVSSLRRGSVAG